MKRTNPGSFVPTSSESNIIVMQTKKSPNKKIQPWDHFRSDNDIHKERDVRNLSGLLLLVSSIIQVYLAAVSVISDHRPEIKGKNTTTKTQIPYGKLQRVERHLPNGDRASRVCRNTLYCVSEQPETRETLWHDLLDGLHPHLLWFPMRDLFFLCEF